MVAAVCGQSSVMNRTDVMLKIVEVAKVGGALPADEAVALVAIMIDRLDVYEDDYERDMAALLKIGATIWDLASGPGGAHDPAWIPPFLRR